MPHSGSPQVLRCGAVPHPGRGLRWTGVPSKMDSHARGCQGEWEWQRVGWKRSSCFILKHLCLFLKKEGCPTILTLLLRHGAKVTSMDVHGLTPLGIAAEYGNADALEILIQHGDKHLIYCLFSWVRSYLLRLFFLHFPSTRGRCECSGQ